MTINNGIIIKSIGGSYLVDAPDGIYECKARGIFRNTDIFPVCGDNVEISLQDEKSGVITRIENRKNYILRPPLSNLDMLVFVVSTCEPSPNLLLLDKFIAVSVYKGIEPVIVFSKTDMKRLEDLVFGYRKVGIKVFEVDNLLKDGADEIKEYLSGKISAFTGNTGVGKTSLLNNIFEDFNLKTGEISKKLGRGRHTTRHVELYKLENGGYVADTPGFSTFETNKYDVIQKEFLAGCFAEFSEFSDKCKFSDCSHTKEKGCAVISAVQNGDIMKSRHESYVTMYEEAKLIKDWEINK